MKLKLRGATAEDIAQAELFTKGMKGWGWDTLILMLAIQYRDNQALERRVHEVRTKNAVEREKIETTEAGDVLERIRTKFRFKQPTTPEEIESELLGKSHTP